MVLKEVVRTLYSGVFRRPQVSHLTVLLVLALVSIFSAALVMRVMPAQYGFYLNEFDPYFDYYATRFIVDSVDQSGPGGIADYFTWRDTHTWYPEGRPVAPTSQAGLHLAGAMLFLAAKNVFGFSITLYDFLVLFPVVFGALTTLVVFLLVRRIAGAGAGVFAALVVAFSPPIIMRGNLGWFKSEPFALFLSLLGCYLFLSLYDARVKGNGVVWRALVAGALLGYANTAWGGSLYFSLVFSLMFLISPFVRQLDLRRTVVGGSLFTSTLLTFGALLPRPGPSIILGPAGVPLVFSLIFALSALLLRGYVTPRSYTRALLKLVLGFALMGFVILGSGAVSGLSGRYLTVVYPFYRTENPLVESVAEHFVPTGAEYFSSYSILIFLGGFGAFLLLRRRDVPSLFALVFALTAVYIASSLSRLMVYSSIALAILGAVGLAELAHIVFKPGLIAAVKGKGRRLEGRPEAKVFFTLILLVLLILPTVYPPNTNWVASADVPVSVAGAGLGFRTSSPDWLEALRWIRENTPPDAVIASWWDYGYWITVMGNRTSLADNATINQTRIAQLGRMFMSDEEGAREILKKLQADYVVVFMGGYRFSDPQTGLTYYFLENPRTRQPVGGDEAKKHWFIKIAGLNITRYLHEDEFTPKEYFWENTVLGRMFPLTLLGYLGEENRLLNEYQQGTIAAYTAEVKYPTGLKLGDISVNPMGSLFRLVFASSSFTDPLSQVVSAVLIYKIME